MAPRWAWACLSLLVGVLLGVAAERGVNADDRDSPVTTTAESRDPSRPDGALRRFLDAEIRADHATSWIYLSADDRRSYPTIGVWIAAHATMPTITGATDLAIDDDPVGPVRVHARLRQRPQVLPGGEGERLPPVVDVTFPMRMEGSVWRVAFSERRITALTEPTPGAPTP